MKTKKVRVNLENGLDVRPVALLVQEASKYDSTIHILVENKKVNAKSIMGMMSLGLCNDEEIEIQADGKDEAEAIKAIIKYMRSAV